MNDLDFIVPILKPVGMSSFDVIRFFKKKYKISKKTKIGHFGTLDPFAEGLLLVGFGRSLKLVDYVHQFCPKTYKAIGVFGIKSDTGDCLGSKTWSQESLLWASKVCELNIDTLNQIASSFHGKYWQSRPMYSAAKLEGRPLYEYARKGEVVNVPQMEREIHSFHFLAVEKVLAQLISATQGEFAPFAGAGDNSPDAGYAYFEATVGSGTYIRVLFEDFCAKVCAGAGHLLGLKRTKIGIAQSGTALNLEQIDKIETLHELKEHKLDILSLLPFKRVKLSSLCAKKLHCGQNPQSDDASEVLEENVYYWGYFQGANEGEEVPLGLIKVENNVMTLAFHANPFHPAFNA